MPKTVAEKLLIKPNTTLWISDPEQAALLEPLPPDTALAAGPRDAAVALLFAPDEAGLRRELATHAEALPGAGVIWVAYPKGNRSDISRDSLWPVLQEFDLRPVSQVAIDDTWSALRFRPLKPGEAPFSGGRS